MSSRLLTPHFLEGKITGQVTCPETQSWEVAGPDSNTTLIH